MKLREAIQLLGLQTEEGFNKLMAELLTLVTLDEPRPALPGPATASRGTNNNTTAANATQHSICTLVQFLPQDRQLPCHLLSVMKDASYGQFAHPKHQSVEVTSWTPADFIDLQRSSLKEQSEEQRGLQPSWRETVLTIHFVNTKLGFVVATGKTLALFLALRARGRVRHRQMKI